jgi:hypothetical protein
VQILYPFHPLCGQELRVFRRSGVADGGLILRVPEGFCSEVPHWMTEQEAARYRLSTEAHVELRALLRLIELVKGPLEDVRL